ncbi:MAG: HDOD domain-containing protein [Acidobacteria bacterium]|nr:HDOD domain-containing protein [Acidobacteriota bacterium]
MEMTAERLVATVGELPPVPDVAAKVMRMISDPDVSAKALQDVIMTDPSMTVNILKIANSALFGVKREVKTLTHAIMLMGFSAIRGVVLALATKKIFDRSQGFKHQLLWKNAISAASVSRFIAEQLIDHSKEEAFISGLLHNIGRVVMLKKFGDEYGELMERAYNDGAELNELELQKYGFSHSEVNYFILEKWNLHENMVNASRYYWQPEKAPDFCAKLAAVVGISVQFNASQGVGIYREGESKFEPSENYLQVLGCSPEQMNSVLALLWEKLATDQEMLSGL